MNWRFWSGAFGLGFVALNLAAFGTYGVAGVPPAVDDSAKLTAYFAKNASLFLTIATLATVAVGFLFVWLLGIRGVLRGAGDEHEWAGTFTFGVGLVVATINFVGFGLFAAVALESGVAKPDAAVLRTLYQAVTGLTGPLLSIPVAFFLAAAAYGTLTSRALPRWTGWLGWVAAALNAAAVPAIFGGLDPNAFYSAAGFAPIVLGLVPLLVYVLGTSVALMRSKG